MRTEEQTSRPRNSIKYITELIDDANLAEKERGRPREIQHFSDEHDLILNDEDEEVKDDKLCDGFVRSATFFFTINVLNYPNRLHTDECHITGVFTLSPQPRSSNGVFYCILCSRYRQGFVYSADDLKYVMVDVICFAIEDVLHTDGHQHPLLLASGGIGQECKACGDPEDKRDDYFVCPNQNCNFTLGFECATLPSKARHRYDDHLLTLTFTAEDDTGEYYCLICEEERDLNHWFYYCAKCEFAAHPQCVLGKHPFIKPGKTYKIKIMSILSL
ncbi:hypothetical protein CJ030_MR1G007060 [Morella rubra]|uniref:DC1 domain-containing protein n=1 Tax=Morella rubra TaxID=262757 RepID=A0A6A1WVT6_9ROSI|nr:hypothetical protein CJ030_MR1G007060 [Morella rubra]